MSVREDISRSNQDYILRKPGTPITQEWIHRNARPDGTCQVWIGPATFHGYGQTSEMGRQRYIHRTIYEMCRGPIGEGLVIDHLCRNPPCCNPDHLEAVTIKENTRRGKAMRHRDGKCQQCGSTDLKKLPSERAIRCMECRRSTANASSRRRASDPERAAKRAEYMRQYYAMRKELGTWNPRRTIR